MSHRALPLPPDQRREALVAATVPLLRVHGRAVTTRQIALAAGVAEGTIFRAFATKEALVDEAVLRAFDAHDLAPALRAIDHDLPLRERLLAVVDVMQRRFSEVFALMEKLGMVRPPKGHTPGHRAAYVEDLRSAMVDLVGPDAAQLRIAPDLAMHYLRLLTFAGTHHGISDGRPLSSEEIVDTVLDGIRKDHSCS